MNNTKIRQILKHVKRFPNLFFQSRFYIWTSRWVYITSMLLLQTFLKPFYCLNHYNRLKVAGKPCRLLPFSYLHNIKSCHSTPASEHSHPRNISDIMALLEVTPVVAQVTGMSFQSNKLTQFYQNSILKTGYSGMGNSRVKSWICDSAQFNNYCGMPDTVIQQAILRQQCITKLFRTWSSPSMMCPVYWDNFENNVLNLKKLSMAAHSGSKRWKTQFGQRHWEWLRADAPVGESSRTT